MNEDNDKIEEIIKKYEITDAQFEKMYNQCKNITFYNCRKVDKPTAIFVGGQTGAGKGGIDVYSEKEFLQKKQNAAILDVDIYRALHPYTTEILAKYPTLYTNITAKTTGLILKKIMDYAIINNYNFIFEGTLKNTEAFETMKQMPTNYKKIVRVMATSAIESLLTAFERNYQQIQISGYGRFTNVDTHNKTYNGVLNTIKVIEESGENIIIEIFKRGKDMTSPIKIFSTEQSKGKASDVLVKERQEDGISDLEHRKERFNNLLLILNPKDEFEKIQLDKLKKEAKYLYLEDK